MVNNKTVDELVAEYDYPNASPKQKLRHCLEVIAKGLDIERPLLLPKDERDYDSYKRMELGADNFMDKIHFHKLILEVIEDDEPK
jgi:hypothetical protein